MFTTSVPPLSILLVGMAGVLCFCYLIWAFYLDHKLIQKMQIDSMAVQVKIRENKTMIKKQNNKIDGNKKVIEKNKHVIGKNRDVIGRNKATIKTNKARLEYFNE